MVGLKSQKGEEMRLKQINWPIFPPVLYHCSPFMLEIFCGFPIQRHWWQGKHLGRWIMLAPIGALLLIVSLFSLYATTCFKIFVRTGQRVVVRENSQCCGACATFFKPIENPQIWKIDFLCLANSGLLQHSSRLEVCIDAVGVHYAQPHTLKKRLTL